MRAGLLVGDTGLEPVTSTMSTWGFRSNSAYFVGSGQSLYIQSVTFLAWRLAAAEFTSVSLLGGRRTRYPRACAGDAGSNPAQAAGRRQVV